MLYNIGDKVVYPMHGAGIIEDIEEKEILGELKKYYVLKLPLKNMKVMLPVDNVDNIGIRVVIGKDIIASVIDVFRQPDDSVQQNWNRRYRANLDKVKTGDVYEVACVVKDLLIMDRAKGLSTGERKMLSSSKQILVSELVLAAGSDEKSIEKMIDEAIAV
jgi:CarD family transcriptional regulator